MPLSETGAGTLRSSEATSIVERAAFAEAAGPRHLRADESNSSTRTGAFQHVREIANDLGLPVNPFWNPIMETIGATGHNPRPRSVQQ